MGNFYAEIEVRATVLMEDVPGDNLEDAFLTLRENSALESRVRQAFRGEEFLGEDHYPGSIVSVEMDISAIRLRSDDGTTLGELYRLVEE